MISSGFNSDAKRWLNAKLMLGRRHKRRPNINRTSGQSVVSVDYFDYFIM